MKAYPENISINGKNIPVMEFIRQNHFTEHERELAGFLKEWYGYEPNIEAITSGSTGTPKTIRLEKEFVAESALRTINYFGLKEGNRVLHCLPTGFIAGKLMVVRALLGNLKLYTAAPETDFSFLQREKFHFAAMVPLQVSKILDAEPSPGTWLQNLEQLLIGGSALPHLLETRLKKIPTACYSSYGMTETATHIALRKINGDRADGYYHCLKGIKVQLSENGCLQIFMSGLREQPLTTTDLAEVLNENTFRILGRADHIIISGGIKFSPEQLERKLQPFIKQSFMISSLPHDTLGRQLVLIVEGTEHREEKETLQEISRKHLTRYEQPRKIIFIKEIPLTPNGKPMRDKISGAGENQ
jgi:o-succinylbenzoate---CoA ligase